ncbi:MAG: hypothetical protein ABII79_12840 [bacterium]
MELTARIVRQTLLISLTILMAPLLLFPDRLGTGLAGVALMNGVFELTFYAVVSYLLFRHATLGKIVQISLLCLGFRLLLGVFFGMFVAAMYSMNLAISIKLGLAAYLPAVLLHIAVTPLVLKPISRQLVPSVTRRRTAPESPAPAETTDTNMTTMSATGKGAPVRLETNNTPADVVRASAETRSGITPATENTDDGFDRAVRYIGEDGSVRLAAVVDQEGLLLGCFVRGDLLADDWAPLALVISEAGQTALKRTGQDSLERIDMLLKEDRIVVARQPSWSLLVISQRQTNDTLNIRINQGLEIIRKYMAQRYSHELSVSPERTYVSSAQ